MSGRQHAVERWNTRTKVNTALNAATLFENAQSGDELSLDASFKAVEIASQFYSTQVAEAIAERWLWGAGWKVVSHKLGCSRQSAFERCLACFAWMDRNIDFENGQARYVGVRKITGKESLNK